MNLHSDDRPYECLNCKRFLVIRLKCFFAMHFWLVLVNFCVNEIIRKFRQRKSLRAHRCEDALEEAFQCEVCGRSFINRKALALHRIHHEAEKKSKEPQEKPFLCDICARGFGNKYSKFFYCVCFKAIINIKF